MRRHPPSAVILLLLSIGSAASAQSRRAAGPTLADYARADSIFLLRKQGLVFNRIVIPGWIGSTDRFWYRHERARGSDIVVVDAANGRKQAAFEVEPFIAALSEGVGARVPADSIPLDSLTVAGKAGDTTIAFLTISGRGARCRLTAPRPACDLLPPRPEGVVVSPDQRLGVFAKDANLWLRDLRTGMERALTADGVDGDFGYGIFVDGIGTIPRRRAQQQGRLFPPPGVLWAPDSRTVLVPRVDQRHVAQYPFLESVPADSTFRPKVHLERRALLGERPAVQQLVAIDVATGTAVPIGPVLEANALGRAFEQTWWSSDGGHLYGLADFEDHTIGRLFDMDLRTGQTRLMLEEQARPGQRLDFNSSFYQAPNVAVTAAGEAIWWSERDGWGHLYRYGGAGGTLLNRITEGPWLVRDLLGVDERSKRIYFTAGGREPGNPYYRHIYRVDFDGRNLTHLSPEGADHNVAAPAARAAMGLDGSVGYRALSPSGKYLVYTYSTPSRPPETVIRRTADASLVAVVETADVSGLLAAGYRPPEEFTVKAADGITDLWGVMYLPAAFDSTHSYPVVDAEYTSPMVAVAPRNFIAAVGSLPSGTAAVLAQLGFVGIVLDSRGTTSRNREFNHAMYGKLDTMGLDDHVAAIRELARRHRFIDTTRVGIAGESFGGWSTIRALLQYPDFFRVGVAGSAPGAFHSMYSFAAFQGRPIYQPGERVAENYVAVDSRRLVDRFKGKLLMTVSELDENVLPGSTLQLIDAFLRADKDVDVVYFPDTGHGAGRYTGYFFRQEWDYFVRHLMGAEPPRYRLRFP